MHRSSKTRVYNLAMSRSAEMSNERVYDDEPAGNQHEKNSPGAHQALDAAAQHRAGDFPNLHGRDLDRELERRMEELQGSVRRQVEEMAEEVLEECPAQAANLTHWQDRLAGRIENARIAELERQLEASKQSNAARQKAANAARVEADYLK